MPGRDFVAMFKDDAYPGPGVCICLMSLGIAVGVIGVVFVYRLAAVAICWAGNEVVIGVWVVVGVR